MVKHKIARVVLAVALAGGLLPVMAFADEAKSTSEISFEAAGAAADETAQPAEAAQPESAAVQPEAASEQASQPAEAAQAEQSSAAPQVNATVQMVSPGENSWRFDNGISTTDGLIEGPLSLDERLSSSSGPNGWFEYQLGNFTGSGAFKGIDVSYHNGVIDWQAVKAAGVDFAIIRCGYGDDHSSQDDAQWIANVRGAQEAGIPFGVYLYSYAKNVNTSDWNDPQSAQSEGEHAVRCLREAGLAPGQVALPVYYDMEDRSMGSDYAGMAQRFCEIVSAAGYTAGIYANKDWWENKLTAPYFSTVEKWVAQYNSYAGLEYRGFDQERDIWQFSSSGRISGIAGNVDLNYTNRYAGMVEPGEQVLPDGTYAIKTSLDASKAIDIDAGSGFPMANVQLYDGNNTLAQRFRITFDDGFYTLVNDGSDLAIDVANGSYASGGNVWQYTQNGTDAQKWRIDRNDDGTYTLISRKSGLALDVSNAATNNGNNIQQYNVNGTAAQKFTFEDMVVKPGEQVLPNGSYTISSRLDADMVLDVQSASVLSGANIQLYRTNDTVAQVFNLTYHDGFYTIVNPNSGKALDVAGGIRSYYSGANVQQYWPNGTDAQLWRIDRNLDGTYTLVSKRTGNVIDVTAAGTENGTNIQCYKPNGTKAQKFRFVAMERLSMDTSGAEVPEEETPVESVLRAVA